MNKLQRTLGYVWASPVTTIGLIYAGLASALGWYSFGGKKEDAIIFHVEKANSPAWLIKQWAPWYGHVIGNVIVFNCNENEKPKVFAHESTHVRQCMRLGIFQPLLYGLIWIAIKFGCETSSPYWGHPFEIDARRVAGEIIDVEGAIKKRLTENV